jgi:uncharacterized repeat protein (TIGR03803 family)
MSVLSSHFLSRVVGVLTVTVVTASMASSQVTEQVIFNFKNGSGVSPSSPLTVDSAGRLYGVTLDGGPLGAFCQRGCGVAFALAPKAGGGWEYRRLHAFKAANDGEFPGGKLAVDTAGNVYGVTDWDELGNGAVYQLSPSPDGDWTETIVHEFSVNDGLLGSGLIVDSSGNLFGSELNGGTSLLGAVYELTPNADGSWSYSVIHSFGPAPDGHGSMGELVLDGAGNLYGTTQIGGTLDNGTVFELSPNGSGDWTEKILYNFTGGTDESRPNGPVLLDARGNIYGTTGNGDSGPGTVFELLKNSNGTFTEKTLHTFANDGIDGTLPASGLTFDRSGNLYGTTQSGGSNHQGTVFKMTRLAAGIWTESVVYNFENSFGNSNFPSGLIFRNGTFYGTTQFGGAYNDGAVFQLKP